MQWLGHQVSDLIVRVRACHLVTGKFGRKRFMKVTFRALAPRQSEGRS